jgi:hypothetical protein
MASRENFLIGDALFSYLVPYPLELKVKWVALLNGIPLL